MQVASSTEFADYADLTIEMTKPSNIPSDDFKSASSVESVDSIALILTVSVSLNIIRPSSRFATLLMEICE